MIRVEPNDIGKIWENIPTYDNGTWILTNFKDREEFAEILEKDYLKEPGEYEFDDNVKIFNSQAHNWNENGYY